MFVKEQYFIIWIIMEINEKKKISYLNTIMENNIEIFI